MSEGHRHSCGENLLVGAKERRAFSNLFDWICREPPRTLRGSWGREEAARSAAQDCPHPAPASHRSDTCRGSGFGGRLEPRDSKQWVPPHVGLCSEACLTWGGRGERFPAVFATEFSSEALGALLFLLMAIVHPKAVVLCLSVCVTHTHTRLHMDTSNQGLPFSCN